MKNHKLTLGESVHIILEILEGLSYAHKMGIVHRDIKPENILFSSDGAAKITDWGIGKFMASATMSKTLGIKGTLNYFAPEQFNKKKYGKVDWQTDIFQIGILFYEMITGENPFAGEDMPEVYGNLMNVEPGSLRTFNPRIPIQLDELILKALQKRKEDRWSSAEVMYHELKRLVGQ